MMNSLCVYNIMHLKEGTLSYENSPLYSTFGKITNSQNTDRDLNFSKLYKTFSLPRMNVSTSIHIINLTAIYKSKIS